jgi:hypothetical protein
MNRFLLLFVLINIGQRLCAQEKYIYTIKADSVKITNSCDTAELIIENHTQTVPGFLFNKGRGRTEFRRGMITLNDSLYLIGPDTLNIYKGRVSVTASNGLTATDGNVKLGGELTDINTTLKFKANEPYDPDYYHKFSIVSSDDQSRLQFENNEIGQFGFKIESSSFQNSASLSVIFNQISGTAGSTNKSTTFYVDSAGFHIKGNMAAGFAGQHTPSAKVDIEAGTAEPGAAPLKFHYGALLATPEQGAVEFDGINLYLTTGSTRYTLSKTLTGQLTTSFGSPSLSAYNSVTTTLSVPGAQPGDVVAVSANTGAVNPPLPSQPTLPRLIQ